MNNKCPTGKAQYKAYSLIAMIYITIILAADVLIYKITEVGFLTITVGSFVTPFWFLLTDVVAEVYGYQMTRRLIWSGVICSLLFMLICVVLINFPSPTTWQYQSAYDQVLGKLPRVFLGYIAGMLLGSFANTYLITKWKILIKGRHFWLRSITSSGVGQLIFTSVTIFLDMFGVIPSQQILHFIAISFSIKILLTGLLAFPSTLFVLHLKNVEGIDVYDHHVSFNPFRLSFS